MTMLDGSVARAPAHAGPGRRRRPGRHGDRLLFVYSWVVIAWLFLPIAVMILFGFNDTHGRFNYVWVGFTSRWWPQLFSRAGLNEAVINSLQIAAVAAIGAGVLGTLLGYAMGRYRFRGSGVINLVLFAAIASPEVVMGASLLSFFVSIGAGQGKLTLMLVHVMFCIPFVAVVVRARVVRLDPGLEEAARDLGAGPFDAFRLVTLPMIFPAVLSGGLLSLTLSIDDFVISNFTSGRTTTFPLWIWSAARRGLPPQVNVFATLIFSIGLLLAIVNALRARKKAKR